MVGLAIPETASEIVRLRAALAASEARAEVVESEVVQASALVSTSVAMIKHLKIETAKLRREQYNHSSERRARLIDQVELQVEELEAAVTEDEIAAFTVGLIWKALVQGAPPAPPRRNASTGQGHADGPGQRDVRHE